MLTVACVLVRGEVAYSADYVVRLRAMVHRWLDRPFRFVCLTDQADTLPQDIEAISIQPPLGCYAFWSKVQLFNPALGLTGRVLFLDLDSLIVGPLAPIVDYPAPFALATDLFASCGASSPTIDTLAGKTLYRKFQGSVMVWEAGAHADLYEAWTPADAARLYTDQDWIGERYPFAAAMPLGWFPRLSQIGPPPWDPDAKVIFAKKPKPHEAVRHFPWFEPLWGGWAAA